MSIQAADKTAPAPTVASNDLRVSLPKLILLEREARKAESIEHLAFIAVNETHRLTDYYQCVCWTYGAGNNVNVQTVSGVSTVDSQSQAILSIKKIVKTLAHTDQATQLKPISISDVPDSLQAEWKDWMPEYALWCPFVRPNGTLFAGLLLTRVKPFAPSEVGLLEHLVDAYSHAWHALDSARRRRVSLPHRRWMHLAVVALLAITLFVPVRESALAPAEIVPYEPLIVSAPARGVIKEFHVRPNELVEAGQPLFSLDDTEIKSRYEVAQKSLDVAKADYLRAAQKSFSDRDSKSELELYKARVEEAALERDYAADLLERTRVRADRDGIAVFADENDWIGQPVIVGQRILTLANPNQAEIQIWLAVEDGINLEQGSTVQMFLNTNPTTPLSGEIRQTSYEPEKTPGDSLAFRLKAKLDVDQPPPRIGLKGTAKVYGDQVFLLYYLLRRPLSVLRQSLGL